MQTTIPEAMTEEDAKKWDKTRNEFFTGKSDAEVAAQMNERLMELRTGDSPEKLVRRTKINRNQLCPCGSGRKFKKCCINKVVKR